MLKDCNSIACNDPTQYSKTVGGYTVWYKMCDPNSIMIDSFTFSDTTTGATPGINFTNVVIPSILDVQDGVEVYFKGSCVAWDITGWDAVSAPIPGKPGWSRTEGIKFTYALKDCNVAGCWPICGS